LFIELYPPQAESFQSSLPLFFTTLLHPLTCFYDPADFLYPIYPYSTNCYLRPTTPSHERRFTSIEYQESSIEKAKTKSASPGKLPLCLLLKITSKVNEIVRKK